MKIFNWISIALSVLFLIGMVLALTLSCKTFEPIVIKDIPPECNFSLNVIKLYYDSKDKSGAIRAVDLCYKTFKTVRCRGLHFTKIVDGKAEIVVDYDDAKRYRNYTECLKEAE